MNLRKQNPAVEDKKNILFKSARKRMRRFIAGICVLTVCFTMVYPMKLQAVENITSLSIAKADKYSAVYWSGYESAGMIARN